jgi:hypothetical protein
LLDRSGFRCGLPVRFRLRVWPRLRPIIRLRLWLGIRIRSGFRVVVGRGFGVCGRIDRRGFRIGSVIGDRCRVRIGRWVHWHGFWIWHWLRLRVIAGYGVRVRLWRWIGPWLGLFRVVVRRGLGVCGRIIWRGFRIGSIIGDRCRIRIGGWISGGWIGLGLRVRRRFRLGVALRCGWLRHDVEGWFVVGVAGDQVRGGGVGPVLGRGGRVHRGVDVVRPGLLHHGWIRCSCGVCLCDAGGEDEGSAGHE